MPRSHSRSRASQLSNLALMLLQLLLDLAYLWLLKLYPRDALASELVFVKKQLALFLERGLKPRRPTNATRLALALLAERFDWRNSLAIVKPETLIRWQRQAFRLLWRWKSRRPGRPPIPEDLQDLIRQVAGDNPLWGEEKIAHELLLKFGIRVSPRTVRKYMPVKPTIVGGRRLPSPSWRSFLRNQAVVATDFFVSVTASLRVLYVFVAMEIRSRRIIHFNVTAHPTSEWTLQQVREIFGPDHGYPMWIHDRDSIYSQAVEEAARAAGVDIWETAPQQPLANCFCERLIGTIRRECLDFVIPFGERHLKRLLQEWIAYYNHGRPHTGKHPEGVPRIPAPLEPPPPLRKDRHSLPEGYRVAARPILGGLHHDYRLTKAA